MEEERGGPPGPFEDLEVIRVEAGMPTARFVDLIGVPERSYRRWQGKARQTRPAKGPWPRPAREAAKELTVSHALAHPAWGHRKVWAMVRHDGHVVSEATVLSLLRDTSSSSSPRRISGSGAGSLRRARQRSPRP